MGFSPPDCKLLVIDDNPADVRLITLLLAEIAEQNFQVITSPSLEAAIASQAWSNVDAVLLDLNFPTLSSAETLRLMTEHLVQAIPVIVATGDNNDQTALRAIRKGAQDYLVKGGFDGELLARTVRHAIERFRLRAQLESSRQQQWRLANYDPLTELPNRRLLQEQLAHDLNRCLRNNEQLALLYIDIDSFKPVNDSLGHAAGDSLLREIARRLQQVIRASDLAARLGGDEFALVLNALGRPDDAALIAEKLLTRLTAPYTIEGTDVYIGASIGIALCPVDTENSSELIRCADLAMYHAKQTGGNNYRFFAGELAIGATNRLALKNGLLRALQNDELELDYQPIYTMANGQMIALEALLRWCHPQHGRIKAADFIPLAEESRLIIDLDYWALFTACQQNKHWQQQGHAPVRVAVNLSAKHIAHAETVDRVANILAQTRLEPEWLELEITETALPDDVTAAAHHLQQLRQLGIRITLDDVGAGFASLSHLRALEVDAVKLDRSLITDVNTDVKTAALFDAVLLLTRRLGLEVVAEGIEQIEHYLRCRHSDIQLAQGFLFAQPQSEIKLNELQSHSRMLWQQLMASESLALPTQTNQFPAN